MTFWALPDRFFVAGRGSGFTKASSRTTSSSRILFRQGTRLSPGRIELVMLATGSRPSPRGYAAPIFEGTPGKKQRAVVGLQRGW